MKKLSQRMFPVMTLLSMAGLASCSSGTSTMSDGSMSSRDGMRMESSAAATMVNSWPTEARKAAMAAMEKYGAPDEATETMVVWHNKGPWKRSTVYRKEVPHDFPGPHIDVWEQVVDYRVPPASFDDLAAYDGSVVVDRTQGEMSARCDKEGANFLALNLADDIVKGRRSVSEARDFYAATIKAFKAGQMSPYMQGLRFETMTGTNDPDVPAMK